MPLFCVVFDSGVGNIKSLSSRSNQGTLFVQSTPTQPLMTFFWTQFNAQSNAIYTPSFDCKRTDQWRVIARITALIAQRTHSCEQQLCMVHCIRWQCVQTDLTSSLHNICVYLFNILSIYQLVRFAFHSLSRGWLWIDAIHRGRRDFGSDASLPPFDIPTAVGHLFLSFFRIFSGFRILPIGISRDIIKHFVLHSSIDVFN